MISAPIVVPEWVEHAACTPDDADLFFTPGREASARALCRVCPVREECLRDARKRGEKEGIWGGVDMAGTGTGAGCRNGHGPEHRIRRAGAKRDVCLACKRDGGPATQCREAGRSREGGREVKPLPLTPEQAARVHAVMTELAALLDEIGAIGNAAHIGNPEWHNGPVVNCLLCDWTASGDDVHQAFLHGIGSGISPALLWEAIRRTDPNPEPIFPSQECPGCGAEHPGQDCPQEALFQ